MNSYRNFRIQLSDYVAGNKRENIAESLKVLVVDSPVRAQYDNEKVEVIIPDHLAESHEKLRRRKLDEDQIIEFGVELAKLLLPPTIRQIYFLSRAKLKSQEGLRIQIHTNEPRLIALPWEYIYVWPQVGSAENIKHAGFLALDREVSIVRHQNVEKPKDPGDKKADPGAETIRIGVLLSDGREAGHQELDMVRERNILEKALAGVDGAELDIFPDGKKGGIQDWLTENNAQVFHFAGHGTIEKEPLKKAFKFREEKNVVLVGEDGGEQLWDDKSVAMALRDCGLRLVVLSACDSGSIGQDNQRSGGVRALVQNGIPVVVGMQFTVRDTNASAFSHQFYLALASGKSIDAAVSEGRQAIFQRPANAGRDWGVPVLYLQTDNAELFPKPAKSYKPHLRLIWTTSIFLALWFFIHIYPWVFHNISRFWEWLGLGGAAVAAFVLVFKTLGLETWKILPQGKTGRWKERLLDHPQARSVLGYICLASMALFSATNSIYLEVDYPRDVKVNIKTETGEFWNERQTLSLSQHEGRLLVGGPVFFVTVKRLLSAKSVPLKLHLSTERPVGWSLSDSSVIGLSPIRSTRLTISQEKAVVLVPSEELNSQSVYYESARLDVTVSEEKPKLWHKWETGTIVYFGNSLEGFELDAESVDELTKCTGLNSPEVEDFKHLDTTRLAFGQSIKIKLVETSEPEEIVEVSDEFTLEKVDFSKNGLFIKCMKSGE